MGTGSGDFSRASNCRSFFARPCQSAEELRPPRLLKVPCAIFHFEEKSSSEVRGTPESVAPKSFWIRLALGAVRGGQGGPGHGGEPEVVNAFKGRKISLAENNEVQEF